eukprot:4413958-Ditylum_brightwellii.AAC.1
MLIQPQAPWPKLSTDFLIHRMLVFGTQEYLIRFSDTVRDAHRFSLYYTILCTNVTIHKRNTAIPQHQQSSISASADPNLSHGKHALSGAHIFSTYIWTAHSDYP